MSDRHHRRASRARPRRTSRTRSRWSSAPGSTARSRSSTRPGRARARPRWTTRSPRRSCRSASTGWSRCRPDHGGEEPCAGRRPRSRCWSKVTARRTAPRRPGRARTGSCIVREPLPPGTFAHARDHRGRARTICSAGSSPAPVARRGVMLRALVGPTASGKTEAGIALATALGAEIVSVDSMLVYRGMDVGTAKPTAEQRAVVPHHLLDLAEPSERFTVARFQTRGAVPCSAGWPRRCSSGVRGSTSGRWSTSCGSHRRIPRCARPCSRRRPTSWAPTSSTGGWPPAIRSRPIASSRRTSAERSERWRSRRSPARRSASSRRHGRCMTRRACGSRASAWTRRPSTRGCGAVSRRCSRPVGCDEVRGPGRARVRRLAHRQPGDRLRGACRPPRR